MAVIFGEEEGLVRRPRRKKEAEKEEEEEAGEEVVTSEAVAVVPEVEVDVREEGIKACRQVRLRRKPSTWELMGACLLVRLRWRCAMLLVE